MNIRTEIAFHPELVADAKAFIKRISDFSAGLATTEIEAVVPLGETFLKPLIVALVNATEAKELALVDHWLDGFTQAQPDVKAGDGHEGLVELVEIDTPKPAPK